MDGLTETSGLVALGAGALALGALVTAIVLLVQVRRLRADQAVVLGERGTTDLVEHASGLEREFGTLASYVEDVATRLEGRMDAAEARLDGALRHRALVRYDAYGELSGYQSSSIALLDASTSGVVISSILHRDQARLYAKRVDRGRGEIELSPEEAEAVRLAMSGEQGPAAGGADAAR